MNVLVFGLTNNIGGIETLLLTYVKELKGMDVHFDFITTFNCIALEDEFEMLGCRVFHVSSKRDNYFLYRKQLRGFFRHNKDKYDAVWLNDVLFCNLDSLKYAKKYNIPKRIIHAHNSQALGDFFHYIRHCFNRHLLKYYATDFWACSEVAANWSYPTFIRKNKEIVVIQNAIDVNKFRFDKEKRNYIRKTLGIKQDQFVIGNIGRMDYQKNQILLIDIFEKLLDFEKGAYLLIVGSGIEEEKLRDRVRQKNLSGKVLFTGVSDDIPSLLQAMDVFVMTSKFEGLGIVTIEAQAAGLPCVLSKEIPRDTDITPNVSYVSLDAALVDWVEQILSYKDVKRMDTRRFIEKHHFSVEQESKILFKRLVN